MQKTEYTFHKFMVYDLQILKTFYKNMDLLSKNCVKRYVLSPYFFKLAKDGNLRKSSLW